MAFYTVCLVSKEYRYVTVEADSDVEAEEMVIRDIDNVMNRKASDYDTEIFVEDGHEPEEHWHLDPQAD
jgi:uncharacterized membrane protein